MHTKTILLVEDDFLNRRLSKKILLESGFSVLEAKNVEDALILLQQKNIDVAILDINLGENTRNGISLGHELKDFYKIPFIYLTAYESSDIISKSLLTAPKSYLTKPFKNTDLITAITLAIQSNEVSTEIVKKIKVKHEDYIIELSINDICYVESDKNYVLFHVKDKVYKIRSTIKNVMDLLPSNKFIQTHRAFIVNKNKISKINLKQLLVDNSTIPVSRSYVENIHALLDE